MDLYSKKTRWKLYLLFAGLVIIILSVFFTNYLVNKLSIEEQKRINQYKLALESISKPQSDSCQTDLTFQFDLIKENTTVPIILMDNSGKIVDAKNFDDDSDTTSIRKELEKLINIGKTPLIVQNGSEVQYLYYKNSKLLELLRFYPFFQISVISAFIFFGYLAFSSSRKAEQNRVWVGMAKETAHQLGTPISALLFWIEHLRNKHNDSETVEIVNELENDVKRLDLIADRFSKIGSEPALIPENVYVSLNRCKEYMEKRVPKKIVLDFPTFKADDNIIHINEHLFDWVIENLLRNALDAMENTGTIKCEVSSDSLFVIIDISDTGKGISPNKFKTVFNPGYSTKQRGWGLGLSLAQRIIQDYHKGKIYVKKSVLGEGSTFCIKLPKY
jgi:Histidine kinase-, DNA gyrase B-, and HSP90-like ATPase